MENVYQDAWDREQERDGFTWKRMLLGRRLGGEMLGASVYLLPPGQKSFPYHLHHANEEMLLVLDGEVTLRTPRGEETLQRGDAELFRRGPEGAHQVINLSSDPARFVMFSTMVEPEIAQYPDSGNVGIFGEGLRSILDGTAERDYFAGEE